MAKKLSIKKYEPLPPELKSKQDEAGHPFMVGDMFFRRSDGKDIIRITEIKYDKKYEKTWRVFYEQDKDWEADEWEDCGVESFDDFMEKVKDGEYIKIDRPLKDLMDEANKVISGEISMDVYAQNEYASSLSEDRAIMGRSSKEGLLAIQGALQGKQNQAELIHRAVGREMEKRRAELMEIKDKLYGIVAVFQKQVKKIMRVITTIELYLGIEEELHQIQEGEKAPADTPISFRQMVLYIDEEVGSHEDGGLDFKNIKEFDKWLVTGSNLDIVLPEKKGVVVLNPRRRAKDYHNEWLNVFWNVPNKCHTYILIRNGDNVYRIFTEKLVIQERLFPKKKELQELYDSMRESYFDSDKEKVEDAMYGYKKQAMLLQGLVDRTEVFHPLPVERLNILNLDEAGDKVRFIYDAEDALHDGKPLFKEWMKKLNSKVAHGSRILITSDAADTGGKYGPDRIYFECREYNYPPSPNAGIYTIEQYKGSTTKQWLDDKQYAAAKKDGSIVKDRGMSYGGKHIVIQYKEYEETHLTILYNPEDTVGESGWTYDPHERKKRIRYRVYPDDEFILNYDQLSLTDITYYLQSRANRKEYLSMMPILKEVRLFLLGEAKKEEFFVQFIAGRNNGKIPISNAKMEDRVRESIRWWKFKNKIKRFVDKDDTLALRMIEKRILSPNYDTFTKH